MVKEFVRSNKLLIARFIISTLVCLTLLFFYVSIPVFAAEQPEVNENITDDSLMRDLIGIDANQQLEVVLLVTLLSLAPSILVMMTSFTRIVIVFSFLRNAMATQQTPPNQIVTGLALFLTLFVMAPVFSEVIETAYTPYAEGEITTMEAVDRASVPLKEFMLRQTGASELTFFVELANENVDREQISEDTAAELLPLDVVIPSFIVSELRRAFMMGFVLFIPFLIIDIVVSSTLMSMGMMMLPPATISLPFKIMLFVLVDGWQLLVATLVSSYN